MKTPPVPKKVRAIVTPTQFAEIYTHLPNDAARLLVETDIETGGVASPTLLAPKRPSR